MILGVLVLPCLTVPMAGCLCPTDGPWEYLWVQPGLFDTVFRLNEQRRLAGEVQLGSYGGTDYDDGFPMVGTPYGLQYRQNVSLQIVAWRSAFGQGSQDSIFGDPNEIWATVQASISSEEVAKKTDEFLRLFTKMTNAERADAVARFIELREPEYKETLWGTRLTGYRHRASIQAEWKAVSLFSRMLLDGDLKNDYAWGPYEEWQNAEFSFYIAFRNFVLFDGEGANLVQLEVVATDSARVFLNGPQARPTSDEGANRVDVVFRQFSLPEPRLNAAEFKLAVQC
jgi:hypothetical protein